ncbi:hypothetical protein TwortDSMZ_174 [Staphylococcus phage Twort]|uniref:Uncharacterized protein n=2 Tax=Staphylococcus phage Twort (strain DSM 17442 / HER 48) TaxID=2908167 RepID=A0A6H0X5P0_BPTWO|nr:ORF237 [Staphylococcus phage Twort]AAX92474.1 ORF237 [Staphylococcus phage Twort]QIW89172.1 hypothetical protein TwortDSMZ_174 [Staphylococcus phage Twort]
MSGFNDFLKQESKRVNKPLKKQRKKKETPIEEVQEKLAKIRSKSKYMDLGRRYK